MSSRALPVSLAELARVLLGADRPASALYPSAGRDTYPLTLTAPEHLLAVGASECPSPSLFVYCDRQPLGETLRYSDGRTEISCIEERLVPGPFKLRAELLLVDSHRHRSRRVLVVRAQTENDRLLSLLLRARWQPDLLIGVCDGCRFGGNRRCVNHLRDNRWLELGPRFWLSDHFRGARLPAVFEPGATVEAVKPECFPRSLSYVACLGAHWGGYAAPPFAGASLFALDRKAQ